MKFKILTGLVTGLVVSASTSVLFCQPTRAGNHSLFSNVAQIGNSDLLAQQKAEDFLKEGEEKYQKGDRQGALEAFSKAIGLNPIYVEAY